MDIMGYKSYWTDEGDIPNKRIHVQPHVWSFYEGEHFINNYRFADTICRKVKNLDNLKSEIKNSDFAVSPVGDVLGHMVYSEDCYTDLQMVNGLVPLMPNYVRDLAGRLVCIAECYPIQKESAVTKRFPKTAFLMDGVEGADLVEKVFFSSFRTLDMSEKLLTGEVASMKAKAYKYKSANLYPYKLRVDSFYQDGWKVPQTEMLFVKNNDNLEQLESIEKKFLEKWDNFIDKKNYEAFYESCGGEKYFEELFNQGFTLIPTLEGYNANPIVDNKFNLIDYHYGKAVSEFHDIVKYVDSDKSAGTILEVVAPGFITQEKTQKAKVVVSNGSAFVSNNVKDPDPLYPDLRLPHTRTSCRWGDVFLPTHPKHFETSAIWGWDLKTGWFIQEKGPIWDPLHYFYESVDLIIDAFQGEVDDDNYWFYNVPEKMKTRFYPIVPFDGFDILSIEEKQEREEYKCRPYTMAKRFSENVFSTTVGYHILPPELEFELSPWLMPELNSKNRVNATIPLNIRDKIAPVALSNVPVSLYLQKQLDETKENPDWVKDSSILSDSTGIVEKDYPFIKRYLDELSSINKVSELFMPFLVNNDDCKKVTSEYISQIEVPVKIDDYIQDMSLAYFDLKERSFVKMQKRQAIYTKFKEEFLMAVWNSENAEDVSHVLKGQSIVDLEKSNFSSVAIMQPPTF